MPLTTADQVRLRIQDLEKGFDETYYFDGTATFYNLPFRNIQRVTAFVPIGAGGGTAWSATGITTNASGWIVFSGVGSANSAFHVRGTYSVFSDAEISQFTADGGSVIGAALIACETLMFDSLKRARWAAPDGTSYDDTTAQQQLLNIYDKLKAELEASTIGESGFAEWAAEENWG